MNPSMQFKRKITNIIKILRGLKKTKRNISVKLKRINASVIFKKHKCKADRNYGDNPGFRKRI